jgi:hypothetical protein
VTELATDPILFRRVRVRVEVNTLAPILFRRVRVRVEVSALAWAFVAAISGSTFTTIVTDSSLLARLGLNA